MKTTHYLNALAGTIAILSSPSAAHAVAMVEVDMDPGTPGIQDTLFVTTQGHPPFTVDLVFTPDTSGVSSYSISVLFDNVELSLNGSPATIIPALPAGFSSLGTPNESEAAGRVLSLAAGIIGGGPTSGSFVFAKINFIVGSPISDDGFADITPGFFNAPRAIDSTFDNAGVEFTPIFKPGFVVPEPGAAILLWCGSALCAFRRPRRRQGRVTGLIGAGAENA